MYLRLLGSAAGGGCPQWNCACRICSLARADGNHTYARTQSSLAISATGKNWYLVNCSPDVRSQIESTPALSPGPGVRQTPLRGVLLTDAELDHTIGLLSLREGADLDVYATSTVIAALSDSFPVRRILSSYADILWTEVGLDEEFTIDDGKLAVRAYSTGTKRPRYARAETSATGWVIAYRFQDKQSGAVAFYAPTIETWTRELVVAMSSAECVFVDGTFWSEDEMLQCGTGQLNAQLMGHTPISGTTGSAARLDGVASRRKILVHINNTNPIIDSDSDEAKELAARHIEVGADGLELEL